MRIIPAIIFSVFSISCAGQTKDTSLTLWLIKNNLLTKSQDEAYRQMCSTWRASYAESINSIKDKKEKEQRKKQIDSIPDSQLFMPFNQYKERDTLHTLLFMHITGIKKSYSMPGVFFEGDTSINKTNVSESYLNDLTTFLGKFKALGFAPNKSYKNTAEAINNKDILDSFSVVNKLIAENNERKYYSPSRLVPFLEKLVRLDILSAEDFWELRSKAEKEEIDYIDAIIAKCKRTVTVNLNDYGDTPQEYEEPVHKKISEILPELKFSDFNVVIEKTKSRIDTGIDYKTICSFINSGNRYSHKNFYSPADYNKDGKPDNEWKTGDDLYTIFNKVLKNKQSRYRVHTFPFHSDYIQRASGKSNYIALEKWQTDSLRSGSYFELSYENFQNNLTSGKITEAINMYKEIGLFSALTKAQIDSCVLQVENREINYYSDILSGFKNIVYEADLEYGVDKNQYKKITKNIAGISRGGFKPTNIIDTYSWENKKKFRYGFTVNTKKYIITLTQPDDWLDTGFWDLIKKAEKEQDSKGQFYDIYPSDGMRVIYLTAQQYKVLQERKILEFTPVEMTE